MKLRHLRLVHVSFSVIKDIIITLRTATQLYSRSEPDYVPFVGGRNVTNKKKTKMSEFEHGNQKIDLSRKSLESKLM